jgi:hypothetical protein
VEDDIIPLFRRGEVWPWPKSIDTVLSFFFLFFSFFGNRKKKKNVAGF